MVQHVTETEAIKEIESQLAKSPRRGAKTEADAAPKATAEGDDAPTPRATTAAVEDEAA